MHASRVMGESGRIGAVLLVAALLAVSAGPGTARSQQGPTSPDNLLRELAARLLTPPLPSPPGTTLPPVRLFPGALPPDVPIAPPLPPGARLIGSVVRPTFSSGGPLAPEVAEAVEVVLDVPEPPGAVIAFYERAFAAQGLTRPAIGGPFRPGGFLPSVGPTPSAYFCQGERGPFVEVATLVGAGGVTDARIRIQPFPGPCGGPPTLLAPPGPPGDPIPALEAPAGVLVVTTGGGGSPVSRSSDAIAETEVGVAAIEAHYARQLAAAGWERRAGGADGPLAWSVWRVPEDAAPGGIIAGGERQGFLVVLEGPTANRRTLHIQVVSAGPLGPGGTAITVVGPTPPVPLPPR